MISGKWSNEQTMNSWLKSGTGGLVKIGSWIGKLRPGTVTAECDRGVLERISGQLLATDFHGLGGGILSLPGGGNCCFVKIDDMTVISGISCVFTSRTFAANSSFNGAGLGTSRLSPTEWSLQYLSLRATPKFRPAKAAIGEVTIPRPELSARERIVQKRCSGGCSKDCM